MTAAELLTTMRATLAEERDAIRRLDLDGIQKAIGVKERLLAELRAVPVDERAAMGKALAELRGELQRNLILLIHARTCLRTAIETCSVRGRLEAEA